MSVQSNKGVTFRDTMHGVSNILCSIIIVLDYPFAVEVTERGRAHIVMAGIDLMEMKLTSFRFESSNDGENSISNPRMIEARMYFASHIANR